MTHYNPFHLIAAGMALIIACSSFGYLWYRREIKNNTQDCDIFSLVIGVASSIVSIAFMYNA